MKGWAAVCRFGGVGDNLVAASTLRPLKKLGYNVEVITTKKGSNTHTVFLNNPFIDKLSLKDDGEIPGGGLETGRNRGDTFSRRSPPDAWNR